VTLRLEKKGDYAVILEPDGMSVAANRGWVERVEELAGKGPVQAVRCTSIESALGSGQCNQRHDARNGDPLHADCAHQQTTLRSLGLYRAAPA
jgi:hypothetical protein